MVIREAPKMDIDCDYRISEQIIRIIRKRSYDFAYAQWFADNPAELYLRIIDDGRKMWAETYFNED